MAHVESESTEALAVGRASFSRADDLTQGMDRVDVLAGLAKVGETAHHGGVNRCQDGGFIKEVDGFCRVSGPGRGRGFGGDAPGPPRFKVVLSNG